MALLLKKKGERITLRPGMENKYKHCICQTCLNHGVLRFTYLQEYSFSHYSNNVILKNLLNICNYLVIGI